MIRASTRPSTDKGGRFSAASEARDRRRLTRLAWASAILFLLPVLYLLVRDEPGPVAYQGNYALLASTAGSFGGEDAGLSTDGAGPAAPVAPAASEQPEPQKSAAETAPAPAPAIKHDQYYCDFYAQAVTGNVKPEQAYRREQTGGAIMGAMGGAVLGALFGGSEGHSGRSSLMGASAGLLAGATMGSGYARRAAEEIRGRYDAAYSACMKQGEDAAAKPAH